jgi:hypothetical protein
MSLWVFGDSFSVASKFQEQPVPYTLWTDLLAYGLGYNEHYNYAEWGVANDYIIKQFISKLPEMKTGDCVVLQLTNSNRQWFFKDVPHLANYFTKGLEKELTAEQIHAIKIYITYLQRDEIDILRYTLTGLAIERISQQYKNLRILMLPGFLHVDGVQGALVEVCDGEFVNTEIIQPYYDRHKGYDPRPNHLSKNNHEILASKIQKFFTHGHRVNLTTDFERNFLE